MLTTMMDKVYLSNTILVPKANESTSLQNNSEDVLRICNVITFVKASRSLVHMIHNRKMEGLILRVTQWL